MPYLKITTGQFVDENARQRLLSTASKAIVAELGKPEEYMMVSLESGVLMLFGGTEEPSAFLELRSIGLTEAKAATLPALLCGLMESGIGIHKDRVYINFTDVPPHLWGWNGETF